MVNGVMDVLKTDDDGAGGTDARLRLALPADGSYLIVAQAFDEAGRGAYALTLDTLPTPIVVAPQPIRLGQTLTGRLTETTPVLDEDDSHYALYTYAGRAGQCISVTLRSSDFDSYLSVGRMENGSFEALKSADDGAGGNDARIRLTLVADGEHVIRVNTMSAGETGAYTLLVESMAPTACESRAGGEAGLSSRASRSRSRHTSPSCS